MNLRRKGKNMPNEELVGFLMGDTPVPPASIEIIPDAPIVPPVAETIVAEPIPQVPVAQSFPDTEMQELMAHIKCIGMCAKDMHYRCKGKSFYGLHQLADLTWKLEEETDQIAEIYFMGERGITPPRLKDVYTTAIAIDVLYPKDDKYFIGGLMDICLKTMHKIEAIKQSFPDLKSGTVAVLDQISQQCLLNIGLLDQTMKGN